ncbi:MAG: hypothetical protein GY842_19950 [bacterium]|nr:hypothetical protein [bacterium]
MQNVLEGLKAEIETAGESTSDPWYKVAATIEDDRLVLSRVGAPYALNAEAENGGVDDAQTLTAVCMTKGIHSYEDIATNSAAFCHAGYNIQAAMAVLDELLSSQAYSGIDAGRIYYAGFSWGAYAMSEFLRAGRDDVTGENVSASVFAVDGSAVAFQNHEDDPARWAALVSQVQEYVDVPMLLVNTVPKPDGYTGPGYFLHPINFAKLAEAVNDADGEAILITINTYHSHRPGYKPTFPWEQNDGVFRAWKDFAGFKDLDGNALDGFIADSLLDLIGIQQDGWEWLFSKGA